MRLSRPGVAAYLEVFLLIAVVAAGSAVVLAAGLGSLASAQGPSVSVSGGSIRQGEYLAVETLMIRNTGNAPFASFEVSTTAVADTASYCYTLYDPVSVTTVLATCPVMRTMPQLVSVSTTVSPGRALVVEITVMGKAFSIGSMSTVTVTTSAGSQGTLGAMVVPA